MDSQGANDANVGVVYPEPVRTYGPPQPKPVYYGPPITPTGGPLMEYSPSPFSSIMDIMSQLPEKLEFLPKVASVLLTVTKILLKVVVLKLILKFVFIFCMYFFLPKLEMLDMMTGMDVSEANTMMSPSNNTTAASPEDQEEMRMNQISDFVMDSVETQKFLNKLCRSEEKQQQCKFLRSLSKLNNTFSISKLFYSLWIPRVKKSWQGEFKKHSR